jgi:HD-like signal output (HDOD) protein
MDVDSLAKRIASDIDVLSDLPSPSPVVARLSATLGDDDVEVRTINDVEDAIMGIDHGMIGEILAAHWMLPRPACAAIRAHHRIDLAGPDYRQNALIVHLAEAACGHAQLADIGEGVLLHPDDPAVVELGIGPESLAVILADAQVHAERAAELIGFGR